MTELDKRDQGPCSGMRSTRLTRERSDGGSEAECPASLTGEALTGPNPPRWQLVIEPDGVAALTDSGTVAEAHVWERDGLVILEFWIDGVDLPRALSVDLVQQAFAHPAVHAYRPVLACVPASGGALFEQACRHIETARTRTAGMTCLIEGRIRQADTPAR